MVRKTDIKRTKIVCTIGPTSSDEGTLREMILAGMDVARINFSHGSHEAHARNIELIRHLAHEEHATVAIMADLQGPKIRLGKLAQEPVMLKAGDRLTLTAGSADGSNMVFPLPHPEFLRDVRSGHRLLVDDGQLEFKVVSRQHDDLICEVIVDGPLHSRKGVSAPESRLTLSALTEKDRADVKFALEMEVDYIAMSFVRTANDIRELRWLCRFLGTDDVAVIAKIEKREALQNFEEILEASDGVMVARGDLGVETPAEAVPIHQKEIIRRCNEAGKPVITATQMLQSMISNPRPTRAEASDVANAIFDGTDAVMLSGETAAGQYPVIAVKTMATIATITEENYEKAARMDTAQRLMLGFNGDLKDLLSREGFSLAVSRAASQIADTLGARWITTTTFTGSTARLIARTRPHTPILCVTPNPRTLRRMALVWGVHSLMVPEFTTIDDMINKIVTTAYKEELLAYGDALVMIAGVPFGAGGHANFLKIHRVGETGEVPEQPMPHAD